MAEKTEKATPKKIKDARKKGQVAKSQDFPAAFTFVVSIAAVIILAGYLFQMLAAYMVQSFTSIRNDIQIESRAGEYVTAAISVIFQTSVPIMVLVSLVGVLVNFLIIGPLFSMQAMKPDIKKLNPVENIKNMFKLKTFVEFLKSIIKIAGALILIYMVIYDSLPEIISTSGLPVIGSAAVFASFMVKVIIRVGIFFLAVALFDLVFQKRQFSKQMMMEKFEIKQEIKDTEGDPAIKGRRRRAAQELAYQEGPPSVRRAKAVITNPVHIAVAIEYDEAEHPAPKIVTMGQGPVADMIVKVALDYEVPIMRNVPLAHELWKKGTISDYIPEDTYQAVAEILKWIARLEESEEFNVELFK